MYKTKASILKKLLIKKWCDLEFFGLKKDEKHIEEDEENNRGVDVA